MLVKSKKENYHISHLKQAFEVMPIYGMKLNLTECTFGVRVGKFLGYMVCERGIESNPEKIEASMRLQSPRTLKEVQKIKEFKWTEECEPSLRELKQYLTSPPQLAIPKPNEKLFMYLAFSEEAMSSVLVREEGKVQSPVYYMSKIHQRAEKRHVMVRPDASRRLVKWAVELGEHGIEYQDMASIKAQIMANFIMEFVGEQIQEK
ncbi:hypothetical protein Sango_2433600 [Sesamum angolense]|uniref:Reverse transcriptase/retrotransposon-derived protein RNase H-like domain-containing protein n=1 Tax=Sesamum angolense TaxID=2727404 RepID=A0AAE1W7K4_9LAMI|nr:hypothetical protein Sango_2433600 [Sesamum angolense]